MNAALQAELHRAAVPGFDGAALDFLEAQIVGPAPQVVAEFALGEGAELAAEMTDVGVVDVAGDDVTNIVATCLRAQSVGRLADSVKVLAAASK